MRVAFVRQVSAGGEFVEHGARLAARRVSVRQCLAGRHRMGDPVTAQRYASVGGAVRHLLRLTNARAFKTVLMPEGERDTICISSQVGSAVDCK